MDSSINRSNGFDQDRRIFNRITRKGNLVASTLEFQFDVFKWEDSVNYGPKLMHVTNTLRLRSSLTERQVSIC